jgi:hypothetical protein
MHGHQHKKITKAPNSKLKTLDSDPSNNHSNPYDFCAQNLMGIEKNMRKGYGFTSPRPMAGNPSFSSSSRFASLHHLPLNLSVYSQLLTLLAYCVCVENPKKRRGRKKRKEKRKGRDGLVRDRDEAGEKVTEKRRGKKEKKKKKRGKGKRRA